MLPISVHISAFLTPNHSLALFQNALPPSRILPLLFLFPFSRLARFSLSLSLFESHPDALAVNANPGQPIDTESITVCLVGMCV